MFFSVSAASIMVMYWKIAAYKIYSFWFGNNQLSMMSNWSNVLLICSILLKDIKHFTWLNKTCFMMFSKKQMWYSYIYMLLFTWKVCFSAQVDQAYTSVTYTQTWFVSCVIYFPLHFHLNLFFHTVHSE